MPHIRSSRQCILYLFALIATLSCLTGLLSCSSSQAKIPTATQANSLTATNQQSARIKTAEKPDLITALTQRNQKQSLFPVSNLFPTPPPVDNSKRPNTNALLENRSDSESVDKEDDEGEADAILERIRLYQMRHGGIDPESRLELVKEQYQQREVERSRSSVETLADAGSSWVSLGPTNGAGRVTSIAPHPTIMGTVYVGADAGGVWKTTDGGTTWVNLTDSISNLLVGAVALAPSSPNIVYLGTGSEKGSGIGLLKSVDGGATWLFPRSVIATRFFRISVHPTNPQELVAGTQEGILRSVDGGSTWTTVVSFPTNSSANDIRR